MGCPQGIWKFIHKTHITIKPKEEWNARIQNVLQLKWNKMLNNFKRTEKGFVKNIWCFDECWRIGMWRKGILCFSVSGMSTNRSRLTFPTLWREGETMWQEHMVHGQLWFQRGKWMMGWGEIIMHPKCNSRNSVFTLEAVRNQWQSLRRSVTR